MYSFVIFKLFALFFCRLLRLDTWPEFVGVVNLVAGTFSYRTQGPFFAHKVSRSVSDFHMC